MGTEKPKNVYQIIFDQVQIDRVRGKRLLVPQLLGPDLQHPKTDRQIKTERPPKGKCPPGGFERGPVPVIKEKMKELDKGKIETF